MKKLSTTDQLAIDRTRLANERTFLAYFRTFIVLLSSGVAILKIELLEELKSLAYLFLITAPVILLIGTARLWTVKRKLKSYYHTDE